MLSMIIVCMVEVFSITPWYQSMMELFRDWETCKVCEFFCGFIELAQPHPRFNGRFLDGNRITSVKNGYWTGIEFLGSLYCFEQRGRIIILTPFALGIWQTTGSFR
jgi:hypothetical protein